MPTRSSKPFAAGLAVACGLGLALGAIDLTMTIPQAPGRWLLPTEVIPAFAMTALLGAALAGLVMLLLWAVGRREVWWLAGLAGFLVTTVFLLSWQGLLDWQWPDPGRGPQWVSALLSGLGIGGAAYSAARHVQGRRRLTQVLARMAAAAPVLLLVGGILTWEVFRETTFRYGLPISPVATGAVVGLICLAIWIRGSLRANGILLGVLFVVPLTVSVVMASRWSAFYQQAPPARERPHKVSQVILITVDTLRADALSVYKKGGPATPHFAALAADSVVFQHAYSDASWTVPSLTSLLSGLPSLSHKVGRTDAPLPKEVLTLAEYFRDAGYYTGAVVQNPLLDPQLNLFQGFAEYALIEGLQSDWEPFGRQAVRHLLPARFRDFGTEGVTRVTESWLRRNQDRDFFLWVHYYDPHVPYEPPTRFRPSGEPPERIGYRFDLQNEVRHGLRLTAEERVWVKKLYLGETRYVDEQIGRLVDVLRELGLYDSSVIALTSDHGEEFWEHGGYEHGHTVYEELLHVPLFVKLPGSVVKLRVERPVSNRLLMPTFLDLAGIPQRDRCSIQPSLAPLWSGGNPEGLEPITATTSLYYAEQHALRLDNLKYIRSVTGREELYNLASDPGETRSLIGADEKSAELARETLSLLEKRYREMYACYHAKEGPAPKRSPAELENLKGLGYIQ